MTDHPAPDASVPGASAPDDVVLDSAGIDDIDTADITIPDTPAEAEWPPREWREARRGGGNKGIYKVVIAIAVIMVILVALAIWGSSNG